uniref:Lectin, mannose binding 2 n=1 Tax=Bos mutus grunniens TaxID=30521 RepID=A0A8B9XUL3_BOSMU
MAAAAAAGWIWRWGWGRRCPGRSGLRGPGPGPTILKLFLLLLGPVAADITDGNSEHLKREHSLIKPYHGPVFGSKDNFHGLAIFLDTYPNDETTERVFPYISVMVNNGSLSYDHSKDGRWTELAGCTADFRNRDHDTFLAVRYSRGRLTVMTDLEDKNEWKNCIDITGVRLPTGYYFGASAGTGDLSDNHDIISMKLFQLMVEHTPDEESIDWTKIEPSVNFLKSPKDNVDDPTGNFRSGPLTGWRVFLLLLCALLGIIVCAVVGAVVFQKRQERNKRFY